MRRRNDATQTAPQEDAADRTMRALLARHNQPEVLPAPQELASLIAQRLPVAPPAEADRRERRRMLRRRMVVWGTAVLLLSFSGLGAWGVWIDSSFPALLFGRPEQGFARIALAITLAAKPIIAVVLSLDVTLLLANIVLVLAAGWLWWRLLSRSVVLLRAEQGP